jgi:rod shape determining protein RodA
MNFIISYFKRFDWVLLISAFLLVGLGLVSLYSSSLADGDFLNFEKQIAFLATGIFLMFLFSFLDLKIFKNNPHLILVLYFISILLLAGLFLVSETRGVQGWYKLGPISVDPIELVKIILVILLAKYFSTRHVEMYRLRHIFLSGVYVFIPCLLIFLQPDLGSVLIVLSLWLTILVISGIKIKHFLLLCLLFIVVASLGWSFLLEDYQKERIMSFVNPQLEPLGASWSQRQAKIAIGSGGLLGKGIGEGSQTQYGFLPETHTDFIFASIAEETGFVGVLFLLSLFSIFIWRIIKIAIISKNNFFRLFSSGFAVILISQFFIHVGMNLGLLPIIGISLPLVSYGGSGLIMTFVGIGFLQNIFTRSNV